MKTLLKKILPDHLINLFWHLPKAILASCIYGFPAKRLTVIGIAGTKGKTSTAYYVSHFLDVAEKKNVLFTTAALKIAGKESLNTLKLTSPTPFFLNKFLKQALKEGCTHAVLEVSSHAIKQFRFWGVPFHVVVLTNLTPDHLEYHKNEAEYSSLHARLITHDLSELILNQDDPHLVPFTNLFTPTTTFSLSGTKAQLLSSIGIPLEGVFNISNVLGAFAAARAVGVDETTLVKGIHTLSAAPGRMEKIDLGQPFTVLVDYAHSPESLSNFFSALTPTVKGKIISVFGACGERDARTRPLMGKILDDSSRVLFITNDDPYSENQDVIANGLLKGIVNKKRDENLFVVLDRKEAITRALKRAQEGDCVCILGKGAEQWQVFKQKKIPWDDRKIVREALFEIVKSTVRLS